MSGFLQLPTEVLLEISHILPPDAILSLKLSHSMLNNTLPPLPRPSDHTRSQCARYAMERLCIPSEATPAYRRCMVCKASYPLGMFSSSSSAACARPVYVVGAPRPEIVDLPPFFCAIHVGRLVRVVRTEPGGRNEWVSKVRRFCVHDGHVQGWLGCVCDCDCGSCGYRLVRTYTRYLNNGVECKDFTFWRDVEAGESADPRERSKGRLFVKENCRTKTSYSEDNSESENDPCTMTCQESASAYAFTCTMNLLKTDAVESSYVINLPVNYELDSKTDLSHKPARVQTPSARHSETNP